VPDPLNTLTHARLRAAQGDARGARAILRSILATDPRNAEASAFLAVLEGRPSSTPPEPGEPELDAPLGAGAADLKARFHAALGAPERTRARRTIARLNAWLEKIEGERG
jgi:hypothetical protein